jgi:ketosteroid isomerase-like protein
MFAGVALMATMPESVTRYLDVAAEGDIATLLGCFTSDAVVHDEGQTFHGHDEIRRWRETVTSRFTYTVTVLGSEEVSPDEWVVRVRLDGNFPGGTARLRFRLTLRDGLISQLTIAP